MRRYLLFTVFISGMTTLAAELAASRLIGNVFGTSNIVAAGLFGLDFIGLGLYFLIVIPVFLLQHTNVQFPRWIDTAFGWIFVTPGYHKVHHEQNQYYTDSNYADIFVWDRLFGTYRSKPVNEIVIRRSDIVGFTKQNRRHPRTVPKRP